jgi:hypothetical protein
MVELHVGDSNVKVQVVMRDANGAETNDYQAGSIIWSSTDGSKVAVVDDDADPKDARVDVLALTEGTPVRLSVNFDGDAGDGEDPVHGETEDIFVVPGPARTAEVIIKTVATPV